ncbi:hypothetical protein EII34_10950 [Arachnia propionica]|uniref:ESX-1 secretion-associated protein n=1 Tax=Arachnia propionica TaxID=1750 RepID=A0A3P1T496_9ACTN|nr:hypothetical protein [Arachnia propionica]RRD04118.1 hypothetical protein EII34_10950 [Arachnia propionica]
MTWYNVDAASCRAVFARTEGERAQAAQKHSLVSADIDSLGALCVGESAALASALNAVYNRVLTPGMTGAEQQVSNAVAGGRSAVSAIQAADHEMADRTERAAHGVDEFRVTDGKPV